MFSKLTQTYLHDFTAIKLSHSLIKYLAANLILFAIPLLFNQPQLLVGSLVNFCLIFIALNFKKSELLPAIFLPSIAAVLNGALLGSLSPFLVVLMPFVWMANAVLVFSLRYLQINHKPLIVSLVVSGVLKVAVLYGCTYLLVSLLKLPAAMLVVMGSTQLATFSIAALAFLATNKFAGNKS